MVSRTLQLFEFEAKPPTAKHQTWPKQGNFLPRGPLRSPQCAIHTTDAALHTWPLLQSPEMTLISRDLPPSPLTSGRPEPHIPVRHGPKGDGSSLNTFARSLLSGRTAPHTCFDTTHRRREIRRNGRRFVTSHALTTSITTPGFWVRSTSTWYPTRTLTFGPFWTRSQTWATHGQHPVRDQG
jgi:hypothetical protein